jgi:hypothetical protein
MRFAQDIPAGVKRAGSLSKQLALEAPCALRSSGWRRSFASDEANPGSHLPRRHPRVEGTIVSLFEPST